jgi:hypothetical protein
VDCNLWWIDDTSFPDGKTPASGVFVVRVTRGKRRQ